MSLANRTLQVKIKTWNRDSYSLYDFETTNYHAQTLDVSKIGRIIRSNNKVSHQHHPLTTSTKFESEDTQSGSSVEILAEVIEGSDGIKILPVVSTSNYSKRMWLVADTVEGSPNQQLRENSMIKLGRMIFRVKHINYGGKEIDDCKPPQDFVLGSIKEYEKGRNGKNLCIDEDVLLSEQPDQHNNTHTCKICLDDQLEEDNPFVCPCKCTGSVKFVHLNCLRGWVKSKLKIEQNQKALTVLWKKLECELCKTRLPLYVQHMEKELLLLPLNVESGSPFVVLESFSKDKEPTGIHLLHLSANEGVKLGRGYDCQLKLSDISISRTHAIISLVKGKLYIRDNCSKFGTLIAMDKDILLNDQIIWDNWFQYGRTLCKFSLKKPWSIAIPCLGSLLSNLCEASANINENEKEESQGKLITTSCNTQKKDSLTLR